MLQRVFWQLCHHAQCLWILNGLSFGQHCHAIDTKRAYDDCIKCQDVLKPLVFFASCEDTCENSLKACLIVVFIVYRQCWHNGRRLSRRLERQCNNLWWEIERYSAKRRVLLDVKTHRGDGCSLSPWKSYDLSLDMLLEKCGFEQKKSNTCHRIHIKP